MCAAYAVCLSAAAAATAPAAAAAAAVTMVDVLSHCQHGDSGCSFANKSERKSMNFNNNNYYSSVVVTLLA